MLLGPLGQDWMAISAGLLVVAGVWTLFLVAKSVKDFTVAGPQVRDVIGRHYVSYLVYAMARLALWCFAISAALAWTGVWFWLTVSVLLNVSMGFREAMLSGGLGIAIIGFFRFCDELLWRPASIIGSWSYRNSRLYSLWSHLSPKRIVAAKWSLLAIGATAILSASIRLAMESEWGELVVLVGPVLVAIVLYYQAIRWTEPPPAVRNEGRRPQAYEQRPNIVMIGCDTLRADRVGITGYRRRLTPYLEQLADRGTLFSHCHVPVARTAPSLASLLTGTWPHTHGIRDNYTAVDELRPDLPSLPKILARAGYATAAVSDWTGSDLGKYDFGFQLLDVPQDQWNIKYLMRQGPKDVRLFLSLFTYNRFGKRVLPEIYFLAGNPLTRHLGWRARELITELGDGGTPFLLNVFMGTAHPPFGSEYPYYLMFANNDYHGESKFAMSRLTEPMEIIRSQREPREAFDLDQIIDLYDGCVRSFDDEVRRIVEHLQKTGLLENTIIVVYSDHGMELFENGTWGQGNSAVGDHSARVPLLVIDPRRKGNGEIRHIVRSIDVAPTLLELVGLPASGGMEGESLCQILDDPPADLRLPAYFETGIWLSRPPGMHREHIEYPELLELLEVPSITDGTVSIKQKYRDIVISARDRMVRYGDWMLVYIPLRSGAAYKLYNMAEDPGCTTDLVEQYPAVASGLRKMLLDWIGERN